MGKIILKSSESLENLNLEEGELGVVNNKLYSSFGEITKNKREMALRGRVFPSSVSGASDVMYHLPSWVVEGEVVSLLPVSFYSIESIDGNVLPLRFPETFIRDEGIYVSGSVGPYLYERLYDYFLSYEVYYSVE